MSEQLEVDERMGHASSLAKRTWGIVAVGGVPCGGDGGDGGTGRLVVLVGGGADYVASYPDARGCAAM